MQSSSPKASKRSSDEKPDLDIEFGKASPLRNPLHGTKKPSPSIFAPKSRPQHSIRPTMAPRQPSDPQQGFRVMGQQPVSSSSYNTNAPSLGAAQDAMAQQYQRSFEPGATHVFKPVNPPMRTVYPQSKPTFTSAGTNGFRNPLYSPPQVVDLTKTRDDDEEDGFDPDAAIRADSRKFGSEDPYMYVDSNKANENIKGLLEGAFDDEEEKGQTRLRRRVKKVSKEDTTSKSFADKLANLSIKEEIKQEDEAEEEAEEDGTVDGLAVKLLPHQVEGVSWMIDKEIGKVKTKGVIPRGGCLADDMGLGKTIQSVTLLLTNPRPALDAKPEHKNQKLPGKDIGKGTLVVAPLALIKQWESEIKTKVTKSHAMKVLVHHGPSRTKSSAELNKYDVVITTYQTLTSEHAGSNMAVAGGARIGCMGVNWYRLILDEAHSIKNRSAKSTLACCALNSWYRWCLTGTPLQNNLDELFSLIKFLRIKPYCELTKWKSDIIQPMKSGRGGLAMKRLQYFLRTFMKRRTKDILKEEGALNFGGKTGADGAKSGGMQIVKREVEIVECDFDEEEQLFYSRLQARADARLQDMMDGNHKTDYMGALVILLRLRQACNHPQLIEKSMNNDKDALTTGSQTQRKTGSVEDDEMDNLAALMGGVSVQAKHCDVCQVKLSSAEASSGAVRCSECEADLAMIKKSKKSKKAMKSKKPDKKNVKTEVKPEPRHTRNRKVVVDSDDEDESEGEWIANGPEKNIDLGEAGGSDDEDAEGGGETLDTIDSERSDEDDSNVVDSPDRAKRQAHATEDSEDESVDEDEDEDEEDESEEESEEEESDSEADVLRGMGPSGKTRHTPSTKIRHLLRILHRESPKHKTIVFSQFTTMLDLIEPHLKHGGISFVRYDGSMKPDEREKSLNSLRTNPKTRVLLCSLKCGSLGLNLTAASRVVIIEPFWNPFVEEQAIDRVHRLNQTVDVKVFRLTMRTSVEERIIELQEKKRELAKAAIEGGKGAGKLSMQDILGLFKHDAADGAHDAQDQALWAKFGNESRLLDGATFADAQEMGHLTSRSTEQRPKGRPVQEHDVFGRRW
ncbi:hypothetical protein M409DRAFT_61255 [Zasmidium cellare ATCC 36951]|uniref:Helicase ATP-binding domain-containing protein n=1 Tax=Zasmidium cellare ATCC 36951 TaxID=1080233 RepID=A0A6A6BZE7_ZASCE|nr:uncharacterized protein M409DRAFT_61255 [Zasmidium cellare ATCC 36951]KAF2158909.1 hypothetical protein M409DRAFT_61255 [Zasmidium cellare ATCC 36951]